jgi:hypothetical protein
MPEGAPCYEFSCRRHTDFELAQIAAEEIGRGTTLLSCR